MRLCRDEIARAGSTPTYPDLSSRSSAATGLSQFTVTIPDPAPAAFINLGSSDASVTYGGVTYLTNSAIGDGIFFNVGVGFSGVPAVLSSQQLSSPLAD